VQCLWWEGGFEASERVLMSIEELDDYLTSFVNAHGSSAAEVSAPDRIRRRLAALQRRLRRAAA